MQYTYLLCGNNYTQMLSHETIKTSSLQNYLGNNSFFPNQTSNQTYNPIKGPDQNQPRAAQIATGGTNPTIPLTNEWMSNKIKWNLDDFHILSTKPQQGTFSEVFFVKNKIDSDKIYVMKKISKAKLNKNNILEAFYDNLEAQQRLDYTNLVKQYGHFEDKEHIYVILENVDNGNLSLQLQQYGRLGENEAFVYFFQACLGLDYLHKNGIAHHDLRPEYLLLDKELNIMMSNSGRSLKEILSRAPLQKKFWYLAPEIIKDQSSDTRADLWSLGVILYELLHGVTPFQENTFDESYAAIGKGNIKFAAISSEAKDLIQQLLRLDPAERLDLYSLFRHPWIKKHEQEFNINAQDFIYYDRIKPYRFSKNKDLGDQISGDMNKENNPNMSNIIKIKGSKNLLLTYHSSPIKEDNASIGHSDATKSNSNTDTMSIASSPDFFISPKKLVKRLQPERYRTIREKMPALETSKEWIHHQKKVKLRALLNGFEASRAKKVFTFSRSESLYSTKGTEKSSQNSASKLSPEKMKDESMTFPELLFHKLFSAFNCCSRIKPDDVKASEGKCSPLKPFKR